MNLNWGINRLFSKKKILEINENGFIAASGYNILKSTDGIKWRKYSFIDDKKYYWLSHLPLLNRLLRVEIIKYYSLKDCSSICIAKKGIFYKKSESDFFKKCFSLRGSKVLNICHDPNTGYLYFGEYFANKSKNEVYIYVSIDNGMSWRTIYTFEAGSINHIHGIFYDKYEKLLWVVTGDRDNECIIANTADGFKTLNIVFRGGQEYRTCNLFFYKEYIVFVTDSEYEQNKIKRFSREDRLIRDVCNVQGSVVKGFQYKDYSFFSTTVEPSTVNLDTNAYVWMTTDGEEWNIIFYGKKDIYPFKFQYGSFEFPEYNIGQMDFLYCYARALKKIGGSSLEFNIHQ